MLYTVHAFGDIQTCINLLYVNCLRSSRKMDSEFLCHAVLMCISVMFSLLDFFRSIHEVRHAVFQVEQFGNVFYFSSYSS